MAKEPRVIIIQTTSEQQIQEAKAAEAGIVNPSHSPGGGYGNRIFIKFKVKLESGLGYQGVLTADGNQVLCELL